jgi:5-methylcytosine-specific restriction endonuclease McrA
VPKDPQDYQKNRAWYLARESSAAGKKKRVERDQARTQAIKDGRLSGKGDPRTVDHKTPLAKGGSNAKANTRIVSATANRRKYDH